MTDFRTEPHAFDPLPMERIVESSGTWDDVRAEDATPLLGVAGHRTRAIEYLVGNHVIAEMGMLVYGDADGHAVFTMDKPSSAFGDRKVANLLRIVGVDADQVF